MLRFSQTEISSHQPLLLLDYFFSENSDTFTPPKRDIYLPVTIEYPYKVSNQDNVLSELGIFAQDQMTGTRSLVKTGQSGHPAIEKCGKHRDERSQ